MSLVHFPGPRLIGFRHARALCNSGPPDDLTDEHAEESVVAYGLHSISSLKLKPGRMVARCTFQGGRVHTAAASAPVWGCRCGFYAFKSLPHLMDQPLWWECPILGVLGWGRIIPAEFGWRSEFQQIACIGLWHKSKSVKYLIPHLPALAQSYSVPGFVGDTRADMAVMLEHYMADIPNAVSLDLVPESYLRPPHRPTLAPEEGGCLCGCGGKPRRGEFLPGHDSKLKARWIRAARSGDADAKAKLVVRGWDRYL